MAGLLPRAGLGLHRRRADEAADPDAARQHRQCHPRQFRARPVRRLRPAHGAADAVHAVGLLRRHRRRALRADLRDRHLRHRVGREIRQCAARRLYRRRRRLLRADPRHHRRGAAAERRQPAQQCLAALCRRALHRHGDVRAGRPDRADLHAHADLAGRADARAAGALCKGVSAGRAGAARLRVPGRACLLHHHRRRAREEVQDRGQSHRHHGAAAMDRCDRLSRPRRAVAAARSPQLPPALGRVDRRRQATGDDGELQAAGGLA